MLVVVVAVIIVYYDYNKSDDNVFVLSCSGQLVYVGLVVMNTTLIHNIHQNLQTIFNVSSNGCEMVVLLVTFLFKCIPVHC